MSQPNFEKYCRQLEANTRQCTHKLLTTRANALRECIADGVVQESTAIKTLHDYALELRAVADEWIELDKLMMYELNDSSGGCKYSRQKCHSPEIAREKRGDFDGKHYHSHDATYERRHNSGGYNEHPIHLEPRR